MVGLDLVDGGGALENLAQGPHVARGGLDNRILTIKVANVWIKLQCWQSHEPQSALNSNPIAIVNGYEIKSPYNCLD